MRNILNYYYGIIVDDSKIKSGYFSYNDQLYLLYEYQRNINEINALDYLNKLMLTRGIMINIIVNNTFNKIITSHKNKNYVLIKVNYQYKSDGSIKFISAFPFKELDILKRNDWGKLWGMKIDYIEYQMMHLKNSFPIINSSIYYYIGLAENAISYFNMLDLTNVGLYLNHRRIKKNNMYNPLELVIDYKVRDIAEYIKTSFFTDNKSNYEIKVFVNKLDLEKIDYILLYVRLLYPSYYFDIYEEIINKKKDEKELNKIISLSSLYEELLFDIFSLIKRKVNIIGIDWINSKFA